MDKKRWTRVGEKWKKKLEVEKEVEEG